MLGFLTEMFRPRNNLSFRNPLRMEHIRGGKLLKTYDFFNNIKNAGKNNIFDTYFFGVSQILANNWYISLINASGYSADPDTDLINAHSTWVEYTNYTVGGSGTLRALWGPGAAAAQSMTNATPATFDITVAGTLKGVFIVGNGSAKGGTTGILWATALFGSDVPVAMADQIKITYTVSA